MTLGISTLLSGLSWFICAKWTYLWNKRFRARPVHHAFCGVASTLTFLFVVAFPSLAFLKPVADLAVARWSAILTVAAGDSAGGTDAIVVALIKELAQSEGKRAESWSVETFLTARHEVFLAQKAGLEPRQPYDASIWRGSNNQNNFALMPYPAPRNVAALRNLASRNEWSLDPDELHEVSGASGFMPAVGRLGEITAGVYAEQAIDLFHELNPFLARLVWPPSEKISQGLISRDMEEYFGQYPGSTYNLSRAITLARNEVHSKLSERTPRVVTVGRWVLAGLFLTAQAIPFGLIGWAAYRDLKSYRSSGMPGRSHRGACGSSQAVSATSRHRVSPRRR